MSSQKNSIVTLEITCPRNFIASAWAAGAIIVLLFMLTSNSANAQTTNPVGITTTVNSGSYNSDPSGTGYLNEGTLSVEPQAGSTGYPQFDGNDYGLLNDGTATVSGGTFDDNEFGLYNNLTATVTVSGGTFHGNDYGLLSHGTATVSGGTFDDNSYGLLNYGTLSLTGGSFSNSVYYDLYSIHGIIDIYGTAFTVGGSDFFGDLGPGSGVFTWTQANGTDQTLSYYDAGGTIDLIQNPTSAPAPESSSIVIFGILLAAASALFIVGRKRNGYLAS